MAKCQFCDKVTHRSVDCPIRARRILGKRAGRDEDQPKCDECGRLGHIAPDCPALADPQADGDGEEYYEEDHSGHESDDDAATHVSACEACPAKKDEECSAAGGGGEACPYAADRKKAIERIKDRQAADGDGGADDKDDDEAAAKVSRKQRAEDLAKGLKPGTTSPLQEADIRKLKSSDIHHLPLLTILPHRRLWRIWVWNKPGKDRSDAFDRLKRALAQKFEVEKPSVAGITHVDMERAKREHEELTELLDPADGISTVTALQRRLDAQIMRRGLGLMAYKVARNEGWPVARAAEKHIVGEADQEKAWGESVAVGRRRVAEAAAAGGGRGGRGGRGGGAGNGGGRGRGQRG